MKVELISITPNAEELIVKAGRTCYKSDKEDTPETIAKFIKTIIKNEHLSVLEHASASFRISEVSRSLLDQAVRHRHHSFSVESQRYVKQDNFGYVIPESIKENEHLFLEYLKFMSNTKMMYSEFVRKGILPEDARYILPNACHTEMVITANFRSWKQFFDLRLDTHAQWEIRDMAKVICEKLRMCAPNVFDQYKEML